jgi:GxxExxY protein
LRNGLLQRLRHPLSSGIAETSIGVSIPGTRHRNSQRTTTDRFLLPCADVVALAIDELTELVIGCAIAVLRVMGPGLLESVYRDCLVIELTIAGLRVSVEHRVPLEYRDQRIRDDLRIDLLVDGRLIVEIKAVDRLHPAHQAQVITYLKLSGCPAGLLLNFNASSLRAGLKRLDHPDIYAAKQAANGLSRRPSKGE